MTEQINASIRKAFVKSGVIVGISVLAAVLFTVFALPRIVDCFYYSPDRKVGTDGGVRKNKSDES